MNPWWHPPPPHSCLQETKVTQQIILNAFLLSPFERKLLLLDHCTFTLLYVLWISPDSWLFHLPEPQQRKALSFHTGHSPTPLCFTLCADHLTKILLLLAPCTWSRSKALFKMPAWPHRSLSHCIKLSLMIHLYCPLGLSVQRKGEIYVERDF